MVFFYKRVVEDTALAVMMMRLSAIRALAFTGQQKNLSRRQRAVRNEIDEKRCHTMQGRTSARDSSSSR